MIYESSLRHHGVKGMKWGVRRYQNADGTLTAAGQARYAKDYAKNEKQKRKNQLPEAALNDPDRWVREDLELSQRIVNEGSKVIRTAQELERETRPKKERMDLSHMTDQELRQRINRELTERQYNDLFNNSEPTVSKGRRYLQDTLSVAAPLAAVTSSALSIAIAIKTLKG